MSGETVNPKKLFCNSPPDKIGKKEVVFAFNLEP